jgi:hypothetical protein
MSRTDGYQLHACPHCDKVHVSLNYVSLNFMAFENWSDGRSYQSLYDSRQGLHRCVGCEEFFLKREANYVGSIAGWSSRTKNHASYDLEEILRRQADDGTLFDFTWFHELIYSIKSWWNPTRYPYQKSKKQIAKEKKELAKAKKEAERLQIEEELKNELEPYPWLSYANDSDLKNIIANKENYSDDLIRSARTLYWMYLNDDYRAQRKAKFGDKPIPPEEIPEFQATAEQADNMLALIELLKTDSYVLKTRIGELYRELGYFDQAIVWLDDGSESYQEKEAILLLARKKIRAPVRIVYAHQRH